MLQVSSGEKFGVNAVVVILDEITILSLKACLKAVRDVAKKNDSILEMLFHESVAIPLYIRREEDEFLKAWLDDPTEEENYYLDCGVKDFKIFLANNHVCDDFTHIVSVFPNHSFCIAVYSRLDGGLFGSKSAYL